MYLVWVMLLVLAASYALCGALVLFAERVIQPRGTGISDLAAPPRKQLPQAAPPS